MPKVTFVQANGNRSTVDVKEGQSVMRAAIDNNIPGIIAECGGSCSCATCHVYVDDADVARMGTVAGDEAEMLDGVAAERKPSSRLSCQLEISAALDGITIHIPATQL